MQPAWVEAAELPSSSLEGQFAFFGLSSTTGDGGRLDPATRAALEQNIARKRAFWTNRKGMNPNDNVRRKAEAVLKLIRALAEALLRGTPLPKLEELAQFDAITIPREIAELYEAIRRLIEAHRHQDALALCDRFRTLRPGVWEGHYFFGYVIQDAAANGDWRDATRLNAGLNALKRAIAIDRQRDQAWNAAAVILNTADRMEELLALRDNAAQTFAKIPPLIQHCWIDAEVRHGLVQDALRDAVCAVAATPDELGLRGALAHLLIQQAAVPLLPIGSPEAMERYTTIAVTAAWCALGVPEAEDLVRPHRMWAALGARRLFIGNASYQCLIAVFTGCLWPFLYNRIRSKSAWELLLEGRQDRPQFQLLCNAQFVRAAHAGRIRAFPWEPTATGR